jgi:hypothetical protein
MKLVNKTDWDSKQLKTIFIKCLQEIRKTEDLKRWRKLVVYIVWHKSWWVGGCAYYHSTSLTMKLPRKPIDGTYRDGMDFVQNIVDIFIHEFGHCLGIKHGPQHKKLEHMYRDWIKETFSNEKYPLLIREKKVTKENAIVKKYQQAVVNCAKATTRFKRAKTILEKWTRKVKYYETKMAAFNEEVKT